MGDTCSLLGNKYPMLYILYMLYKKGEIFKSICSVDSVAHAERGGLEQASPHLGLPRLRLRGARQSHHPAGVLAKARGRTWLRCKGRASGSLGAFPLTKVKAGNFVGKSGHTCSSQGQSPGPGSALFVRNSQHGEPSVAHPLPSSPAQGGNPPAATQHDISKPYGQRETIPRGVMSDGGRDQL